MSIIYEKLKYPTRKDITELSELVNQLTQKRKVVEKDIKETIKSTTIHIARDTKNNNKIIGTASLTRIKKLTANFGTLEDVVVDKDYRKQGIATKLIKLIKKEAVKRNMKFIEFTSNPARKEANKLYEKLGLVKRETNVYRIPIQK